MADKIPEERKTFAAHTLKGGRPAITVFGSEEEAQRKTVGKVVDLDPGVWPQKLPYEVEPGHADHKKLEHALAHFGK